MASSSGSGIGTTIINEWSLNPVSAQQLFAITTNFKVSSGAPFQSKSSFQYCLKDNPGSNCDQVDLELRCKTTFFNTLTISKLTCKPEGDLSYRATDYHHFSLIGYDQSKREIKLEYPVNLVIKGILLPKESSYLRFTVDNAKQAREPGSQVDLDVLDMKVQQRCTRVVLQEIDGKRGRFSRISPLDGSSGGLPF